MFLEFAGIRRQAGLLDKLRQLFSNQDIRHQHFIRPAFPQDISLLGRISGGDDVGIGRQGTARGHPEPCCWFPGGACRESSKK